MTTFNKILSEFKNSNVKIISIDRLKEYIHFCLDKDQGYRVKNSEGYSLISYHHILPRALFEQYKNLKENPWNGTYLLYADHYYVHWLLTEAINDYGQLSAFCAMHNRDLKSGRINESDLIPLDEFQKKMKLRNEKISKWYKENPYKVKEAKKRQIKTCSKIKDNGKTIYQENGEKYSRWYKENPDKVKEIVKKHKETKRSKEWKETIGKEAIEKHKQWFKNNPDKVKENGEKISRWFKNNPDKVKERSIKHKKTISSKEWQETVGKEAVRKQKETTSSKEWKETKGKEAVRKQKETKNSKEWKETKGIESTKKRLKTIKTIQENGKTIAQNISIKSAETMSKIQEDGLTIRQKAELKRQKVLQTVQENGLTIQENAGIKISKIRNSKEWKETKGIEAKRKEKETKNSKEWQENVLKPVIEKRKKLMSSKEWKEKVGKKANLKGTLKNMNYYVYNIYRNNELIMEYLIVRDLNKIAIPLKRATRSNPLGVTRRSKLGLNKSKKLFLTGMYCEKVKLYDVDKINEIEDINEFYDIIKDIKDKNENS